MKPFGYASLFGKIFCDRKSIFSGMRGERNALRRIGIEFRFHETLEFRPHPIEKVALMNEIGMASQVRGALFAYGIGYDSIIEALYIQNHER